MTTKTNAFNSVFGAYCTLEETITCIRDGYEIFATLCQDDFSGSPADRDEGFYPSLDPNAAGYIGSRDAVEYSKQMDRANAVMEAWRKDEWFYCGVVLSVRRNGVLLEEHAASLYGIECNYPDSDNSYLTEVANELLDEALAVARRKLQQLCGGACPACGEKEPDIAKRARHFDSWTVEDIRERWAEDFDEEGTEYPLLEKATDAELYAALVDLPCSPYSEELGIDWKFLELQLFYDKQ